ncbi:Tim44/TimA family putative adaptor protein [Rhizosaccharibacter radicis]|uniref:Tim44/TimA family putative adaptor protein n=1 Tax=Rhizosaccharibacter radicis TaxID=2782605 RepID=A0ABT1VVR0_9PROT|nr:Tim44/TimA family putative adaptor protein [Acetobacteraceae bacterium KSS12]
MHFNAGNFPVDIVLFGLIALFLVLRLRSILGKRTGLERPAVMPGPRPVPVGPVVDTRAEPVPPPTAHEIPEPSSAVGQVLNRIRDHERGFDPAEFLRGAEAAFRRIVTAYAAGDRATLRDSLTPEAFSAFDGAIAAREAEGQTQRSEIRSINQAQLLDATLVEGGEPGGRWRASIDVRFVSDQISLLLGRDGQPVSGADAVTELADLWTFERLLGAPKGTEPGWRLAAARSA